MLSSIFYPADVIIAEVFFVITYLLLIWERIPKVVVALLGATGLIILGVITQDQAFASIDFNVIFLLVGMMIIINILKQTGAIRWLALFSARRANGSAVKLMLAFAFITAVLSAFLDNVTTILVMASVTCALAKRLKINAVPFLMTEVIASNIGGAATLIGDPPNIMIGSAAKLSFNDFLWHLSPVIVIILGVTLGLLYLIYRKDLVFPPDVQEEMNQLSLEGIIVDRPLMNKALVIIGLVILSFMFHHVLHLEVGTLALAGASILMLFENKKEIWDDVEWTTIFFFIGLFIIVGAVEKVGTLHFLAEWFVKLTQEDFVITNIGLLWLSGILSGVIDNIPYTATMIPVIQEIGTHFEQDITPFWWSLALGACLGGNATMIGATANVIMIDTADREGYPIRFFEFFKIGFFITVISLTISSFYIWWRYLL